MFERYDQKVAVFAFMVVFMSYCPQFWVLGRFAWLVRPDTCLGVRTKNSSFSRFMAVFMSYFPHFWVPGRFACLVKPDTCLKFLTKNSSVSRYMVVFMSYSPQFWGLRANFNDSKTQNMFASYDQKLIVFVFYGRF